MKIKDWIAPHPRNSAAFSLIEVLTSMTILIIMMAGAAAMLDQTQKTWTTSWSRTAQFRDARLAFEVISRNLSQSTLNTYWDYTYDAEDKPEDYERQSELHFYTDNTSEIINGNQFPGQAVFFQAVLGYTREQAYQKLDTLLNARGYFVQYIDDSYEKPKFLAEIPNRPRPVWRFRLMEFTPPTENNMIYFADYQNDENQTPIDRWFSDDLIKQHSRPVVDNVIALIFSPQTSPNSKSDRNDVYDIAPNYKYDSRDRQSPDTLNTLPPLVKVTLIAIDEPTAQRLFDTSGSTPPNLLKQSWFKKASDLESDLNELKEDFKKRSINYRIFSNTVAIRSAKWSH